MLAGAGADRARQSVQESVQSPLGRTDRVRDAGDRQPSQPFLSQLVKLRDAIDVGVHQFLLPAITHGHQRRIGAAIVRLGRAAVNGSS